MPKPGDDLAGRFKAAILGCDHGRWLGAEGFGLCGTCALALVQREVAAERERCAEIALCSAPQMVNGGLGLIRYWEACHDIAFAIRTGEKRDA